MPKTYIIKEQIPCWITEYRIVTITDEELEELKAKVLERGDSEIDDNDLEDLALDFDAESSSEFIDHEVGDTIEFLSSAGRDVIPFTLEALPEFMRDKVSGLPGKEAA